MEEKDVLRLYETSRRLVHETSMAFHRQLLSVVNWGSRLICIKGAKGTGKTTLLLQHIRDAFGEVDDKCLFISLDNIWFAAHDVIDLVDWHWKHGGTHLFLDEVHRLKSWQTIVKNIYDSYPSLNIVYTGSSMLQLESKGGDLSRRRVPYTLPCLSFREYLKFEGVLDFKPCSLVDILGNHRAFASEIVGNVRILEHLLRLHNRGHRYVVYRRIVDLKYLVNCFGKPDVELRNSFLVERVAPMFEVMPEMLQDPYVADNLRGDGPMIPENVDE